MTSPEFQAKVNEVKRLQSESGAPKGVLREGVACAPQNILSSLEYGSRF